MTGRAALAAISAAILAYEVLLVRLFAIVQWHHFASMAIGIALLGFGISGTLLALGRAWFVARPSAFATAAALFAFTAPAAFLAGQRLPFNPLAIVWSPAQLLYLGALYLLLAVPFTAGATCVGLAFVTGTDAGRTYRANLLGSAAGALATPAALTLLSPTACLAAIAALALAAAALAAPPRLRPAIAALALAGAALWTLAPGWTALRMSPYKGLPRALDIQGAELTAQRSGPLALLSAVASPAVPFRHAPGLSLLAPAQPGGQVAVFVDGDAPNFIEGFDGRRPPAHLDYTPDALVYALTRRPRVLVLGAGGGQAVLQAVAHASHVDATELDWNMIRMVRRDFADFAGNLYGRPDVTVRVAEPRSFLAGTPSAWDVIRLPDLGASQGLGESYTLTVEALALYHSRLRPNGWLTASGPVDLPPRAALRLAATALAALDGRVAAPAAHLIAIRGLTTFTLLVKQSPVAEADIAAAPAFAGPRGFDVAYYPGMPRTEANRLNVLPEPELYDGIAALAGPGRADFIARYKFDVAPPTDDRPYFHDFFRWRTAPELFALRALGGAAMLQWGEIVVAATLVQAIALSAALVLLPLALAGRTPGRARWPAGGYFFALGLAFLFVEIAFIQRFTLFLGHPLYAVAVALAGFLAFAGLGAGAAEALARRLGRAAIPAAAAGIAALAFAYLAALPAVFDALARLPGAGRVAVSLALIAPIAALMGLPFPLGLARLRDDPGFVPWAWGLNGCASVIGASAATMLAMHLGFMALVALAAILYGLAALAARGFGTASHSVTQTN